MATLTGGEALLATAVINSVNTNILLGPTPTAVYEVPAGRYAKINIHEIFFNETTIVDIQAQILDAVNGVYMQLGTYQGGGTAKRLSHYRGDFVSNDQNTSEPAETDFELEWAPIETAEEIILGPSFKIAFSSVSGTPTIDNLNIRGFAREFGNP